jgi:hypothetical protein
LFTDLVRDAGAEEPELLGRQLEMLYDGAMVSARIDTSATAAAVAKQTATTLLDAAIDS